MKNEGVGPPSSSFPPSLLFSPSLCLSGWLPACLSVYTSVAVLLSLAYKSMSVSVLSFCLYDYPSVCMPVCPRKPMCARFCVSVSSSCLCFYANPAGDGIFSGSSHTSDLKIGTPVATLPGAWRYRVSTGTGRPGVSILWLGEVERWICNFYLSVAARKIVWADPSLRYTSLLLGR